MFENRARGLNESDLSIPWMRERLALTLPSPEQAYGYGYAMSGIDWVCLFVIQPI